MHSWIYRNRDRLRLVYGALRSPEELLEDHPVESESTTLRTAPSGSPTPSPRSNGPLGTVERLENDVLLTPMPRMVV